MLPNRKVGCCLCYTSRLQSHYLIAFKQKLINSSREQAGQISEQAWHVLYKSSISVQLRSSKWTRCTKLPTSLLHNSRQVGQFTSSAVSLHEHYFARLHHKAAVHWFACTAVRGKYLGCKGQEMPLVSCCPTQPHPSWRLPDFPSPFVN